MLCPFFEFCLIFKVDILSPVVSTGKFVIFQYRLLSRQWTQGICQNLFIFIGQYIFHFAIHLQEVKEIFEFFVYIFKSFFL